MHCLSWTESKTESAQRKAQKLVPNYYVMIIHMIRIVLKFKQMAEEMLLQSKTMSERPGNCKGALDCCIGMSDLHNLPFKVSVLLLGFVGMVTPPWHGHIISLSCSWHFTLVLCGQTAIPPMVLIHWKLLSACLEKGLVQNQHTTFFSHPKPQLGVFNQLLSQNVYFL